MIGKKAGRIVNMVGGGTSTPFQFASAYGSSKAAVMRFTETLAVELQQTGNEAVKVFALTPGFVKTAMTESFEQSEEGQKWMSGLLNRMKQGDTVSPRLAADMVVEIGSGRLDGYHGRYLSSERDHDQIDRLIDDIENVLQSDQRTLRLIK
jgi:NAD(P)-dependent dehydrogenase (short-subunit alcohol dehydrogenase family)